MAIVYGIGTLVSRAVKPTAFSKLAAMKERYGYRSGLLVQVVAYSLAPIVVGLMVASAELAGKSLFGEEWGR